MIPNSSPSRHDQRDINLLTKINTKLRMRLDVGETAFAVGFNAGDAARVEDDRSVAQQGEAKKQVKGDDAWRAPSARSSCNQSD